MTAGIYAITHVATGRRYIGRAVNLARRIARHRRMLAAGCHENKKLQRAWAKYGPNAFDFKPVLICAPVHLEFYEQRLIDGYDAVRKGFNICPISGAPMAGRTHSAEARARQSQVAKGRVKPQSVRDKLAAALRGVAHPTARVEANRAARSTVEARAATSARMMGNKNGLGVKHAPDSIEKMRASWTPERKAALAEFNRSPARRAQQAERFRSDNPRKKAL